MVHDDHLEIGKENPKKCGRCTNYLCHNAGGFFVCISQTCIHGRALEALEGYPGSPHMATENGLHCTIINRDQPIPLAFIVILIVINTGCNQLTVAL